MEFAALNRPGDLTEMPDGTLVVWQRIADDPTSTAVAFLHHETTDLGTEHWLSPGGWEPLGLEVIENWETVRVLIDRTDDDGEKGTDAEDRAEGPYPIPPLELPERTDADYRDRALSLAVQWTMHDSGGSATRTIGHARDFEAFLRGESK
ncbi:hypothetical protein SEA_LIGMA_53 [Gordonia phage Ligma]|nr:hypothetical protein SEA_LIGMA_53 [Gordonia phage Ligma]UQT02152.1 hypothetical protein SEA_AXUMITE_53 [Gordonia phage Axumite]